MPMFVSVAGTTPYVYKLLNDLGLFDRYIGLILMSCGVSGFGFLKYYSIFKNISHTYSEAAMKKSVILLRMIRIFIKNYIGVVKLV